MQDPYDISRRQLRRYLYFTQKQIIPVLESITNDGHALNDEVIEAFKDAVTDHIFYADIPEWASKESETWWKNMDSTYFVNDKGAIRFKPECLFTGKIFV